MKGMLLAFALLPAVVTAATCNPEIVKKTVKTVRREITVAVIGEPQAPRKLADGAKDRVQAMIDYWTAAADREIASKPDLVVTPETSDLWQGYEDGEQLAWLRERGDRVLKAWQAYAAKNRCYVVYATYRDRKGGAFSNCCFLIDRDGDVVAVYDKYQPTVYDLENEVMRMVPGEGATVAETDFGTVGFLICFDINFNEVQDLYAPLRPDILVFPSYCDGGSRRRDWAVRCQSHFIAATVGRLDKSVIGPSGEPIFDTDRPRRLPEFNTFSCKVNTNARVCFLDFNDETIAEAKRKYGGALQIKSGGRNELVTLVSTDPEHQIDDICAEFKIETWSAYAARSEKARRERLAEWRRPVQ